MIPLEALTNFLDIELRTADITDYPGAINGLQLANSGEISHIFAAVDFSSATVSVAAGRPHSVLLVHHGMFWGATSPIVGRVYDRVATLIQNDIAVYSSHLPLDMHPVHGNNVLLARELGLSPESGFAHHRGIPIGVQGSANTSTADLARRVGTFCSNHGHHLVTTAIDPSRQTRRWGICTGSGASTDTINEAIETGIDTLIVGEGPHHTAVHAADAGMAILYAGHYATETLGVQSISEAAAEQFGLSTSFIAAPTGL